MATLTCKASGDPLPRIAWRKWSKNEEYVSGPQPGDGRILVEDMEVDAPDYTEGERVWVQSTLTIQGVNRSDDGLYECAAQNEGGTFFQSGHITVEFGPTFEEQVYDSEWSWKQRPVNLSCIATAIPNATISWWFRDIEISRDCQHQHVCDKDEHYTITGHGPSSILTVTPASSQKHYGTYTCKGANPYGEAFHQLKLFEADLPRDVQGASLHRVTATTIELGLVGPSLGDSGQLPTESYAVEYKETRHQWNEASKRYWPVAVDGRYVLENLAPATTIDMRFAARNRVGFSQWSAGLQVTTLDRARPEVPQLVLPFGEDQEQELGEMVVQGNAATQLEVSWRLPQDNGLPIDWFLVEWVAVRRGEEEWVEAGEKTQLRVPHPGSVSVRLRQLQQWTVYKVWLR